MIGKHASLKEITWQNIQARYGLEKFTAKLSSSDLVAFVNWTMLPYMSDLWEAILRDVCPALTAPRRLMFFDLADPEKRTPKDILARPGFDRPLWPLFRCHPRPERKGGAGNCRSLRRQTPIRHPGSPGRNGQPHRRPFARRHPGHPSRRLRPGRHRWQSQPGPGAFDPRPKVTTGAGDHFNSGFCLGKLLGLDNDMSLLAGVATSGYLCAHRPKPRHRPPGRIPQPRLVTPHDRCHSPHRQTSHDPGGRQIRPPRSAPKRRAHRKDHAGNPGARRRHAGNHARQQGHRPGRPASRPALAVDSPGPARRHRPALHPQTGRQGGRRRRHHAAGVDQPRRQARRRTRHALPKAA